MSDVGRHDRRTAAHQEARYRLRTGMAKVALAEKVTGQPSVDCYGQPLRAHELAERHSLKTIERWARGYRKTLVGVGMDFCARCRRVTAYCRCDEDDLF